MPVIGPARGKTTEPIWGHLAVANAIVRIWI